MQNFRLGRFDFLVSTGCLALLGYFGWYALEGSRGMAFRDKLMTQKVTLETELTKVPESVDPDLADELARRALSMAKPTELIVNLPQ
jgi:cell division protein FtsB